MPLLSEETPIPSRARTLLRPFERFGIAAADQALSTGTNVFVTVVAARALSRSDFGMFGLIYLTATFCIGVIRAVVGEPALVERADRPDEIRDVLGSGLLLSGLLTLVLVPVGVCLNNSLGAGLVVLGCGLPAMLTQDVARYLSFAHGKPHRALAYDATWLVVDVVGFAFLHHAGRLTAVNLLIVWTAGGVVSAAQAVRNVCDKPPRISLKWVKRVWPFSWRYTIGYAATTGAGQITVLALGTVAGISTVGTIRGVQLIFGPLNPLYATLVAVLVPQGALGGLTAERFKRQLVIASVAVGAIAGTLTIGALALPSRLGVTFLGATWLSAHDVVLPAGISAILAALGLGGMLGLKAAKRVSESLRIQLWLVPIEVALPLTGAVIGGASGFMWATAATSGIAALVWWVRFAAPSGGLEKPPGS